MRKIAMYRQALVEVHENDTTYLAHIPWRIYLLAKMGYAEGTTVRLVLPWQWKFNSEEE